MQLAEGSVLQWVDSKAFGGHQGGFLNEIWTLWDGMMKWMGLYQTPDRLKYQSKSLLLKSGESGDVQNT